ncbi:hypothetical protein ABE438_15285 [Bosea sp. TWI1241]
MTLTTWKSLLVRDGRARYVVLVARALPHLRAKRKLPAGFREDR